jgi:hypothetical protein
MKDPGVVGIAISAAKKRILYTFRAKSRFVSLAREKRGVLI